MTAPARCEGANVGDGALGQVEERAEMAQQGLAGGCRLNAAIVPAQKGRTQPLLHVADTPANGREGKLLALGCAREAALLGSRLEDAQAHEIETNRRPVQRSPSHRFLSQPAAYAHFRVGWRPALPIREVSVVETLMANRSTVRH